MQYNNEHFSWWRDPLELCRLHDATLLVSLLGSGHNHHFYFSFDRRCVLRSGLGLNWRPEGTVNFTTNQSFRTNSMHVAAKRTRVRGLHVDGDGSPVAAIWG